MLFNSVGFMIFFPIVVVFYFAIPKKYRYVWLLIANYYFYMCWNVKYALFLSFSIVTTYLCARMMKSGKKKIVLWGCILVNVAILGVFKYFNWGIYTLNHILEILHMDIIPGSFDFILPIGISFYTFQSIGYLIDVYREEIKPEKNLAKYALFVSFFPSILSGPIERSGNLLKQIQRGTDFSYENAKRGLLLMLFGFFQKLLIANRIALIVDETIARCEELSGMTLMLAMILYAIQIYTDFAGYSCIAMGVSEVLGFQIINNFRQPYLALNIKDFWKRWHISLSQWLRDYVYISLGGSRCSKIKTYRNLMLTFLISGVWHGAGWNYVIWGGLHGFYQIMSGMTLNIRKAVCQKMKVNEEGAAVRFFQALFTFFLVDFAWVFFRASSVGEAVNILKKIIFDFNIEQAIMNREYLFNMNMARICILIVEILLILLVDILHEKKISVSEWLAKRPAVVRWGSYLVVSLILLIGILYNYGVEASTFIYSQF